MSRPPSSESPSRAVRRQSMALPSWRKHFAAAASLLGVVIGLPVLLTALMGNEDAAVSRGDVPLIPAELPKLAAALDDDTLGAPDLLAGEVPIGENPTDVMVAAAPKVDALGNPLSEPANAQPAAPSGPKLITIDGQVLGGPSRLPAAPQAGLTKPGTYGPVPARARDGRTALSVYKRPFSAASGRKPVSLIIGGLGVNRSLTQQAIDSLPANVTLSFAAHSVGLQDWINTARADGHEILLEIPMEGTSFDPTEPGADRTLRTNVGAEQNGRNLDWMFSRGQGYFGVINYNGEAFLQRADAVAPMLDRLQKSGVAFIMDGDVSAPTLGALSRSVSLPYRQGAGLIDPAPDTAVIANELVKLAASAKSGSAPIGVGFAYPQTIEAAVAWIDLLDSQGLELAPASSAVSR